jgi:Putative carbohydrate metabolism domain
MKNIGTILLACALSVTAVAQTNITNGGFENWGNTVPAGDTYTEPTNWYSNQSGSSIAALGGQTCFKDASVVHSGSFACRVETISTTIVITTEIINGNVTTGVVDAPTLTKSDGYIGTVNTSLSSDVRHMAFTGRPDSLVGWYQYVQGGSAEQGKVRAILHTGDYYDPETPTTYHPDPTANKIADLTFLTPASNVSTWTRFSMPFNYVSGTTPAYIMINATSSADQGTTVSGSKLWLDDLEAIYIPTSVHDNVIREEDVKVYTYGNFLHINFVGGNEGHSEFTLLDAGGRVVYSGELDNSGSHTLHLDQLSRGIYFYRLQNSDLCKTGRLVL